jgi:hypothetical protein
MNKKRSTLDDLIGANASFNSNVEKSLQDEIDLGSPWVVVGPQEQTTTSLVELHDLVGKLLLNMELGPLLEEQE